MSAAPTYRPEIDGLRALAVLPVIFYHAGLPGFGGGFVGVDVFFVISGYLITRLILAEIAEGRFSLWRFYERRARRIWPALFLVLFVTAPFACFILFPHALVDFGESYLATALSLSNVHFYLESGYFSDAAALKPLLHTWSLGVEEQYYLLAPFLALLLCRLGWRALLLGTLLLIAVSFGWLLSSPSLDATFFLPMSRVWELQLGALLAVLEQKRARALHPALSPLGLAMIAAAVVLLDENLPYPSTLTLLPTLGTALVIAGGSAYVSLLAHRWLVAIGLISYSAYLWHQPLFALTRAALRAEPAPLVTAGLIAATFLLAWGSWRFVERPFRSQAILRARFWRLAAIALLAQIALGALLLSGLLSPDRGPFSSEQIAAEKTLRGTKMKELCDAKGWAVCDQPAGSARHGLIIGDSHAVDGLNALAAIFPQDDFSISLLGGCPPHPALDRLVPARHPDLADCLSLNQKRFDPAWLAQFDYVAISVLFDWFKPSDLAPFLAALKAAGIERVLIFGDGFVLSADLPEIINRYGFDCPVIESYVQGTAGRFDETLAQMAAEGGFLFISKKATLCPKGNGCLCELIEGALISWDRNHLSFAAASRLLLGMTEEVTRYLAE